MTAHYLLSGPRPEARHLERVTLACADATFDGVVASWLMNDPTGTAFLVTAASVPADKLLTVNFVPQPVPAGWPSLQIGPYTVPDLQHPAMPGLLSAFYAQAGAILEANGLLSRVRYVTHCPISGYDLDSEFGPRSYDETLGRLDALWAAAGFRPTAFVAGCQACTAALTQQPWMQNLTARQAWFTPGDPPQILDDGTVAQGGPNVFDGMLDAVAAECGNAGLRAVTTPTTYTGGALSAFDAAAAQKLDGVIFQLHGYDKGNVFTAAMVSGAVSDAIGLGAEAVEWHLDMVAQAQAFLGVGVG